MQEYKNNVADEIDVKEIFIALLKSKFTIIFFAFLGTFIAGAVAYFSPNIYSSETTLEIASEKGSAGKTDMLTMAFGIENSNMNNQIDILKSRFIAEKALENLSIGTRYFITKNFKQKELYKNSPFVIKIDYFNENVYGKEITLIPINDKSFRLELKHTIMEKIKILLGLLSVYDLTKEYDKVHEYNKAIVTPWAKFTVVKLFELENALYSFSYVPNKDMTGFITSKLFAVSLSNQGTMIKVYFEDTVAKRASEIVDAIANAFLIQEIELNTNEAGKTLGFIDFQLKTIKESLEASSSTLESYKSKNQLIDLESKAITTANELSELEAEFYTQNIELELLENLSNHISENRDISSLSLESSFVQNNDINQLFSDLQTRVTKKKSLLVEFTEYHPDVLKLNEEINNLKNMIKNSVDNKLLTVKNKKRQLLYGIKKHKETLKQLPEQQNHLASLTRTYMVDEKIYSYLLEKRAETAILRASTVSKTRIIDSSVIPRGAIKPNRVSIVLIGLIIGLIFGASIIMIRHMLNNKLSRVEELEKLTDISIYGSIPNINKKNKQPFYEALRVMRTNLQFTSTQSSQRAKVIAITSSIAGEGKTLISVELVKILAQTEKKVLIIDLDMRKSKLKEHFKVSNQHGISTYLAGKSYKEQIIQSTELVNLDVITGGAIPPNPSELLISSTFSSFINELRGEYDYIVFDTAPIGLVTDAMTPLLLSDIALFTIRADYTQKELVQYINRLVKEKSFTQVGLIFNGSKLENQYGHGYGYGYGEK